MAAKRGKLHHNFHDGTYATPEQRKRTAERKVYMAEYQRNRRLRIRIANRSKSK